MQAEILRHALTAMRITRMCYLQRRATDVVAKIDEVT